MANFQAAGVEFEEEVFGELNIKRASREDDLFKGIDFRSNGLPVDLTYNFVGKDHTEKVGEYHLSCGSTVEFGIRTGNSHKGYTQFEEPVLVIGVELPDVAFMKGIVQTFAKKFAEISEQAEDLYWGWMDAHEEALA